MVLGWNLTRNLPPNWWLEVTVEDQMAHVLVLVGGDPMMVQVPFAPSEEEARTVVRDSFDHEPLLILGVFWAQPVILTLEKAVWVNVPDSLPNSY